MNRAPLRSKLRMKETPAILAGFLFFAVLVILVGVFWLQLKVGFENEIRFLSSKLNQHNLFVEFAVRNSIEHLDTLRMISSDEDEIALRAKPQKLGGANAVKPEDWPEFSEYEVGGTLFFSLDKVEDRDLSANIVGEGRLNGRESGFYEDMEQALMMNSVMRSMIYTLPNASRIKFIGRRNFAVVWPWRPSPEIGFNDLVYQEKSWAISGPVENPEREKEWSPTYFAGKDVGMLVPVSAPVYRGDQWVGVVSIENSLDYLNRLYKSFDYKSGELMLVDESGDVLAHPGSYANPLTVEKPPKIGQVLPESLTALDLMKFNGVGAEYFNGFIVFHHEFKETPWRQYFVVKENEIWMKVIAENSLQMLVTILVLVSVFTIAYFWNAFRVIGFVRNFIAKTEISLSEKNQKIPFSISKLGGWFDESGKEYKEYVKSIVSEKEASASEVMNSVMEPNSWPVSTKFEMWGEINRCSNGRLGLYDNFSVGKNSVALILADINGNGIFASLFGIIAKTLFRVTRLESVEESITKINSDLHRNRKGGICANFLCILFNGSSGRFTCCKGDYESPMIVGANGSVSILSLTNNACLGSKEDVRFQCDELDLNIGDTVLFFNKSLMAALAMGGSYDPERRLMSLFEGRDTTGAQEAVERVTSLVRSESSLCDLNGDLVCVALSYKPQRS